MTDSNDLDAGRGAAVRLPPWMAGNNILAFTNEAGLRATPVDPNDFRWELETIERCEHRSPRLVMLEHLAGSNQPAQWQLLNSISDPGVRHSITLEQLTHERDRILSTPPGDLTSIAAALKLVVTSIDHLHMPQAVSQGYEALAGVTDDTDGSTVFPDVSCAFIRVSSAIMKRLALARVLMRIDEEPDLLRQRPTPVLGSTAFGSGWHLSSDLSLTRDAYFAPLFLSGSPWIWCILCPRIEGVFVFNLGACVVGRRGEAAELLQIHFPGGTLWGGPRPVVSSAETTAALTRWIEQTDKLLSQLSDFANYCRPDGQFLPRRLFEAVMSTEQLGRRIQGILAHKRDVATRKALAFDAFDTLKGLGDIDLFEAAKLSRAKKTLASLTALMPSDAAELLLRPAQRAVTALKEAQSGFFLPSRTSGSTVRLPDRRGSEREWPIDEAVVLYLQMLRNANHGFTPERERQ